MTVYRTRRRAGRHRAVTARERASAWLRAQLGHHVRP